ncbi:MAG: PrsW family glutamic-type intramembrane protease, partial [Planctomycetia bacterium]
GARIQLDENAGDERGVTMIEESAKLFPVLWMVRRLQGRAVSVNTVVFLGVLSGLAFGATEAIVYSYRYVESLVLSEMSAERYITTQILRFISLPLLHAVWCGISSYFLALSRISQQGYRVLIAVGLATSMILHGSYNTFADSWVGFGITILSLFLFVGYIRTGPMNVMKHHESGVTPREA